MIGRVIALDYFNGREAAALIEDGKLVDFLVDGDAPRPGAIYMAVADRPAKGQGGMFLSTPDGSAFLRQAKDARQGSPILAQVNGYPDTGKAIPVTARVLFKSRYVIITPGATGMNISRRIKDDDVRNELHSIMRKYMEDDELGLILRSSCLKAGEEEISKDIIAMRNLAVQTLDEARGAKPGKIASGAGPHELAWRDWDASAHVEKPPGSFERHGVHDMLDFMENPHVSLNANANMYVEQTRAMVTVDVNTGDDRTGAAGLKANLAMAKELPRQLRIRGMGGQVSIDLAPMSKKHRGLFESALRKAFMNDVTGTALCGWTPLGHFELRRKRDRAPLSQY
ncbi:MAG: ribonuclease E/G [Roseovarius sp.]|nr:ribonuclease E/G [Roseovarius sp.]